MTTWGIQSCLLALCAYLLLTTSLSKSVTKRSACPDELEMVFGIFACMDVVEETSSDPEATECEALTQGLLCINNLVRNCTESELATLGVLDVYEDTVTSVEETCGSQESSGR